MDSNIALFCSESNAVGLCWIKNHLAVRYFTSFDFTVYIIKTKIGKNIFLHEINITS